MKTGLLLSLFLALGSWLSAAEPVFPAVAAPAEITQFYHDVNFAACFSTPEERKLVSHMIETSATDKLSARLRTLAQAVQRIRSASVSIDPHMVHDGGLTFKNPDEELTEIVSLQRTGNNIRVEVSTRSVSSETRSWLVAQFENKEQKQAPAAGSPDVLAQILKQTARHEVHVWHQVHGRWVREEAAVVLLKLVK
ncbi:hypothetical protein [Prosthecobacter sp.]|uniref:hypothetical protein n=1 Tax=Prosthecobacter sp. TaxID=1965333 RepID=UPI003783607C